MRVPNSHTVTATENIGLLLYLAHRADEIEGDDDVEPEGEAVIVECWLPCSLGLHGPVDDYHEVENTVNEGNHAPGCYAAHIYRPLAQGIHSNKRNHHQHKRADDVEDEIDTAGGFFVVFFFSFSVYALGAGVSTINPRCNSLRCLSKQ